MYYWWQSRFQPLLWCLFKYSSGNTCIISSWNVRMQIPEPYPKMDSWFEIQSNSQNTYASSIFRLGEYPFICSKSILLPTWTLFLPEGEKSITYRTSPPPPLTLLISTPKHQLNLELHPSCLSLKALIHHEAQPHNSHYSFPFLDSYSLIICQYCAHRLLSLFK